MTVPALVGRTALVTGAGSGLGSVLARHLASAGCRVVLVGRDASRLGSVMALLDGGPEAHRLALADVSLEKDVARIADELSDENISILVNNAGVGGPVAPLTDITLDEWEAVFAANVRSIFLFCRAFLPGMYARGEGDVVNIASVTGKRPLARRTAYAASKSAVLGLTRTLAFEAGPRGVRVNSLSPGPIMGERMARNFRLEAAASGSTVEAAEHAFVSRAALLRLVEADEVGAGLVAMLQIPGMCGADIDLSAGMIAPA